VEKSKEMETRWSKEACNHSSFLTKRTKPKGDTGLDQLTKQTQTQPSSSQAAILDQASGAAHATTTVPSDRLVLEFNSGQAGKQLAQGNMSIFENSCDVQKL
jgi:hypothetical protein